MRKVKLWPTVGLLLGSIGWYFANGKHGIGLLAWIFPFFIVYFLHSYPKRRGMLYLFLANYLVQLLSWKGMVPIPGIGYYLTMLLFSLLFTAPFLLDRLVKYEGHGFSRTLLLPLLATSVDFLNSSFSPHGSNGMLAYSQYDFPWLLQVLSVTGIWGLSFLLYWPASLSYFFYTNKNNFARYLPWLSFPLLVYASVFIYGALRYTNQPSSVKVIAASFTLPVDLTYQKLHENGVDLTSELALSDESKLILAEHQEAFFEKANRVITENTDVLSSSEANLIVEKESEPRILQRISHLAQENNVAVFIGAVVYEKGESLSENNLYAFDSNGKHIATYQKSFIVPGDNNQKSSSGPTVLPTDYGNIGLSICFDMDFPQWAAQYGRSGVELMISPASDWKEVSPYHTRLAVFRAIENGFSLLRHTNKGHSVLVDGRGRTWAEYDYFSDTEHTMFGSLPVSSYRNIYPYTYDLFGYIACLVSVIMLGKHSGYRKFSVTKLPILFNSG